MPVYQGSYKSILGGVSQQVYTDRQLSQVEEQVNMTSDTVRGLRKRPGTRHNRDVSSTNVSVWSLGNFGHLRFYTTNLGWGITTFVVNTLTGYVTAIVETETVQFMGQSSYLVTSNPDDIVFTTVGNTMYVANCSKLPVLLENETRMNPGRRGYFFVLAGAYGKTYSVRIQTSGGAYSASYKTPEANATNAATESTPEYIIGQLSSQLNSQIGGATGLEVVQTDGAYMYLQIDAAHGDLNVSTGTGSTYAIASNTHTVDLTTKLPARLPSQAGGFIMTVGDASFAQYFQWSYGDSRWIEKSAYGSPTGINPSGMPLVFKTTTTQNQHSFAQGTWPGRTAGDDNNNPIPAFTDANGVGITGLASFQGRLIIFSGPYICMGSSNKDDRQNFFRTTVTQVLDDDRIEFTASSFAGASFRYGVPFNSDLILASEEHQAVIPGRNQILTPNNATAVLTSTYQMDTGVAPTTSGRSLYYSYPRSNSSFSVKEMVPSGYTDLQYVSQDVTDHLPTYLEGANSYISASTTNNIVVFGSNSERSTLYINEYLWSGDEKVLSSWHRWEVYGTIHAAWFVREVLVMLVEQNGHMNMLTLSMRDSPDPTDPARFLPAVDYAQLMTVTNPATDTSYIQFAADGVQKALWDIIASRYTADGNTDFLTTVVPSGSYIGAEVGVLSVDTTNRRLYLQPSYGSTSLYVGLRFTATFSPTPPRVFNQDGSYMDVNKMIIMDYNFTLRYTSLFNITASDRGAYSALNIISSPIRYTSQELGLESAMLAKRAHLKVRMGLEVESSSMVVTSNTAGDLNIQGLGYYIKFYNRTRRI
ncbi:putative tail tubular protein B [Escherichia phage Lidtsur]|uniref:Putative tail tubular protein B n=1 Tax=Escherichia phage Lidtsur TaxID=2562235 RepID=A0A4D6DYT9_9CAUD|nr:putative tail tubular protein B [Escherichia phage Lidtsur]QBZ71547.1 putative tail tubular protein B [Escherichia phage Lidtsur]